MKKLLLLLAILHICTFTFAQTLVEKVYKQVNVNDEMLYKWLEVSFIKEYDNNGNMIYLKDRDGYETWFEYDNNGNQIHYKHNSGYETWSEYDNNGNQIHYKSSDGYESWYEYDSNGNEIHYKSSTGNESWYEYTYWDNGKVKTKTEFSTF